MNEWEGYCPFPVIYEPDTTLSLVLDQHGNPYQKEPRRQPIGFILKPKGKENG
jgi:hypothetical protein